MLIVLPPCVGARKNILDRRASDEKKGEDEKQKRVEKKNRITAEYLAAVNEVEAEQQAADEANKETEKGHSDALAKEDENLRNARAHITEVTTQRREAETAVEKANEQVKGKSLAEILVCFMEQRVSRSCKV